MRYRSSLDGVRGAAIAAVLVAHSTRHGEGGVLGVDVFFVLSGFLITGLLYDELRTYERVNFRAFYMRRWWRLMPPLGFALILVALLPNVYLGPLDGSSSPRWQTILLAGTYSANFAPQLHVAMGFLAHTWSLAVEEQFYILWPAAFVALAKRSFTYTSIIALIVVGIAARPFLPLDWLPARGDELLLGSLVAMAARDQRLPTWLKRGWAGWGAVAILLADCVLVTATHASPRPRALLGITVVGVATAILLGHLECSPNGSWGRLLSLRPLVGLGKVSYSVYLLHYPLFQWVAHQRWSLIPTYAAEIALLVPAVFLSWVLVERPARVRKQRWAAGPRENQLDAPMRIDALPHEGRSQEAFGRPTD